MKKNIRLMYEEEVFETTIPERIIKEEDLLNKKVRLLKMTFAETCLVKKWLSMGFITRDNCHMDDDGNSTNYIAEKTLSSAKLQQFEKGKKEIEDRITYVLLR